MTAHYCAISQDVETRRYRIALFNESNEKIGEYVNVHSAEWENGVLTPFWLFA